VDYFVKVQTTAHSDTHENTLHTQQISVHKMAVARKWYCEEVVYS